jgi:DNA-binding transcriptional ArsR family regulator
MKQKKPLAVRSTAKKVRKKTSRAETSGPALAVLSKKFLFEGGFVVMGRMSLEQMVVRYSRDLGKESWLVFMMLCARLDLRENKVVVNQAELGRLMGLTRQNVHVALKQLIEAELIFEGPKEKQSRTYSLSPEIVFRGSAEDHAREIEKHRKKRTKARMKVLDGGKSEKPTK